MGVRSWNRLSHGLHYDYPSHSVTLRQLLQASSICSQGARLQALLLPEAAEELQWTASPNATAAALYLWCKWCNGERCYFML